MRKDYFELNYPLRIRLVFITVMFFLIAMFYAFPKVIENKIIIEESEYTEILKVELVTPIQQQQKSLNKLVTKCETNTINNTIMQNNSFNLNIFLNENCKDALNMSDFLNSIQIEIKDLEYTKKHGINEGIIQLFLERFRELGTYKRPIHCSDLKREILYVKDNNIWNKDEEVSGVIIQGSGEKSFVAGADIKEFSDFKESEGEALSRDGQKLLFDLLENCSTPSIAAVNGFALGGGLELAMACHIRIASKNAKLGLPETSLGVIPGYGGTQRLPNLVGKGKAIEMIATAQMISAEEALKWGLVNQVVEQENLLEHCRKIAFQIIKNSPMAIDKAIKSINAGFIDQKQGFEMEKKNFGECFGTSEFKEGVSAFLEKRKANF